MRNAIRATVITVGLPLTVLLASPALAEQRYYEGDDPGPGLTAVETLGLFVGIPALVIAVLYLLVFAGSGSRGPRYRAGVAWQGKPEWWGGPDGGTGGTGGAGDGTTDPTAGSTGGGGARAHW